MTTLPSPHPPPKKKIRKTSCIFTIPFPPINRPFPWFFLEAPGTTSNGCWTRSSQLGVMQLGLSGLLIVKIPICTNGFLIDHHVVLGFLASKVWKPIFAEKLFIESFWEDFLPLVNRPQKKGGQKKRWSVRHLWPKIAKVDFSGPPLPDRHNWFLWDSFPMDGAGYIIKAYAPATSPSNFCWGRAHSQSNFKLKQSSWPAEAMACSLSDFKNSWVAEDFGSRNISNLRSRQLPVYGYNMDTIWFFMVPMLLFMVFFNFYWWKCGGVLLNCAVLLSGIRPL